MTTKTTPEEMTECRISTDEQGFSPSLVAITNVTDLAESAPAARRLIVQGAVRVNGKVCNDPEKKWKAGTTLVLQAGRRRFAQVHLFSLPTH